MTIVKNISDLSNIIADQYSKSLKIGLVPTMGSLHNGHLSLIKIAKEKCDVVWVSIFINPTQFNNLKDYESYPKQNLNDIKILKSVSSNIYVFFPAVNEIYNKKIVAQKFKFDNINKVLEGKKRPGHFDGVATIIMKLFKIFKPSMAFFGEKDYQQTLIVQYIIDNYFPNIDLIICPTIRNIDGLALSSRNKLISDQSINQSKIIFEILNFVKMNFSKIEYNKLIKIVKKRIEAINKFKLEYFEIRENITLNSYDPKNQKNNYRAFICVKIEGVRLIDNLLIN